MENLVCDNGKAKAGLSVKKRNRSLSIKEIQRKYYPEVPDSDFKRIVAADVVSSNPQTGKVGMYAKWMLRLYSTQRMKMDDLRYAKQFIPVFEQLKSASRLQERDINSYTSLSDMYTVVQPYLDGAQTSKTAKTQWIKRYEAEKLYDDETFTVIHPKTQAASCLYGAGTQWCTAAKNNSAFDRYNDQGKLYIIIHKPTEKKFQLHFESGNLKGENDDNISPDEYKMIEASTGLCELFIRELSVFPESHLKNAQLALFYSSTGNHQEAVDHFQKAVAIEPDDWVSYNDMGVAYSAMGKYSDAIKCYRKAILINSFEFLCWKNMADEYYKLEQYAKVIRYGRIAFMLNPQMTSTANLLGMGYGMTGKYKEAIVYFKKAIALDSENLNPVHNLKVTYQKIEKEKLRRSGRAGRKASA